MNSSIFETVVVGVDFSPYSKIVVKQAVLLAKSHRAHLVFVYAMNNSMTMAGDFSYLDFDRDIMNPTQTELLNFYKLKTLKPEPKIIIKMGRASDEIISVAQYFKTPLIVIGHKGTSSLAGRFFIGSTAEELALRSPFPVWVHRGNKIKVPKNILLPCDYSKRTTDALEIAKGLNKILKSKYEFLHVAAPEIPFLDAAQWRKVMEERRKKENSEKKLFQKRFPRVPLKSQEGLAAELIRKESAKFDLIAMARHHRKGLFSGFGSVTSKVIRSGNTPVLITP